MAIDPITGLPSSNTQRIYAGDKQIAPSPVIDATKIGTTPSVIVPPPITVPTATYTAPVVSIGASTQSSLDAQRAQMEADRKMQESLAKSSDISMLQSQLGGESQDRASQYASTGVNASYNRLQDINAQMTALSNSNQAIPIQNQLAYQGTAGTQAGVQSVNRDQLAQNALKALTLGQEAAIAEGNYNKAKNLADQQVDAKYAQIKADIESRKTQLASLDKYSLSPAQEKAKMALERQYKKEDDEASRKIAEEKEVSKMIIDASPYAPSSIINQAKKLQAEGKSPVEVAISLGKYGGDFMGDLVKQSTIAKNKADIAQSMASYEKTIKEIKMLGQAPQINAPVGTNANFIQNLAASAVNKESLSQSERTAVTKNLTVLDQLDSLQANIAKQNKTGFITGKVNNVMASIGQNADVGTINAQLQAIVPNLARGVYGEVGVLTDNDIENYRKTLPTLTMPKDQNDAVLALTLKVVQKNLKNTLETAANSKMDVSRFAPQYQEVTNKINEINDRIGVSKQEVLKYGRNNPQAQQMIADLSAQGMKPSQILQVLGVEN